MKFNVKKRFNDLRSKLDIDSITLAEQLGISNVYLSYLENDKRSPSLELIEKLCSICNITLSEFFNEDKELNIASKQLISYIDALKPDEIKLISELIKTIISNHKSISD